MCNTTTGRKENDTTSCHGFLQLASNKNFKSFKVVFFRLFAKFSRLTPGISMPLYNLIYGVYRKP